jgi:hypothetical protein
MISMSKRKDTYISSLAAATGSSWWLAEVSSGFLSAGFDQYKESIKQTLSVCLPVCRMRMGSTLFLAAAHDCNPFALSSSHILIATHFFIIVSHFDRTHFPYHNLPFWLHAFHYHHLTFWLHPFHYYHLTLWLHPFPVSSSHILSHSHLVLRSAKHASQQQQQNETPILRQIQ